MITDSQVHIWEIDKPERPWPQPPRNQAQLPDGYSTAQMLAEMDKAGVDRAVIVPPTWVGENNLTAMDAAREFPGRFAIMGRIDVQRPDLRETLGEWRKQPGMLGVRHTFRNEPYATWLDTGVYDPFWAAAEEHDIPVMCLVSGVAGKLGPIAERHPGLTLIVDHMGCDLQAGKGADSFRTLDQLIGLAKYPNVFVKTSSAPCFSAEPYPFADIYPFLRQIYDAFGAQRMMWGADKTRLTSTYEECVRHFSEGLDFLSATDKEWVLGKTTATVLDWPEK